MSNDCEMCIHTVAKQSMQFKAIEKDCEIEWKVSEINLELKLDLLKIIL